MMLVLLRMSCRRRPRWSVVGADGLIGVTESGEEVDSGSVVEGVSDAGCRYQDPAVRTTGAGALLDRLDTESIDSAPVHLQHGHSVPGYLHRVAFDGDVAGDGKEQSAGSCVGTFGKLRAQRFRQLLDGYSSVGDPHVSVYGDRHGDSRVVLVLELSDQLRP